MKTNMKMEMKMTKKIGHQAPSRICRDMLVVHQVDKMEL